MPYEELRTDRYYFISCHNSEVSQISYTGGRAAVACELLTPVNSLFVLFRAKHHFCCQRSCACVFVHLRCLQEENYIVITHSGEGKGELKCHEK